MNGRFAFVFLLVCIGVALSEDSPKIWAVLVAGSNTWGNYRHQSDVYHAYQILHSHGIPDENIIVMHYDDIAYNKQNPTPGIIINQPNGTDVYHGVPKDYTGKNVTSKNFISVLTGDQKAVEQIGGRVLESGPDDHVFVYYTDHGSTGLVAFPAGPVLTSSQLISAIKKMHEEKRYKKLVFYVEACESGSMFRNLLPNDINVFATTASDYDESSYAWYYDSKRRTYLGDEYSINWMEDSDANNIQVETLQQQFLTVKKKTTKSHVQEYGDLKIGDLTVGEFQGRVNNATSKPTPNAEDGYGVPAWDVPLDVLYRQLEVAQTSIERVVLQKQIETIIERRNFLESIVKRIASRVAISQPHLDSLFQTKPPFLTNLECHHDLIHAFGDHCFQYSEHPFALKFSYVFANICEHGLSAEKTIKAMQQVCGGLKDIGRIE